MLATLRIKSFIVVAVAVILSTAIAPSPVQAGPESDIWTFFYDCALNEVGQKFRGCDGTGFDWGQLSGYFKEVEVCSCGGTGCETNWYEWDGSFWVPLPGPPSPAC
jgi:hypothetical protein